MGITLGACDPTVYPSEPMAAYGDTSTDWHQCSAENLPGNVSGLGEMTIENKLGTPVNFIWVDVECRQQLIHVLEGGETFTYEGAYGFVYTVRDPETFYIYTAWQWLKESKNKVAIP